MTREELKYVISSCGCFIYRGHIYYEESELIKAFEDLGLIEQEQIGDVISRQAVDTLVDELARAISDERCCISRGRSTATIMQDILDLPPVTPQPKTGHWIFEGNQCFSCSSCGRIYTQKAFEYLKLHKDDPDFPNNCPNCGAKMVEKQERSE